jgi:SAM-dependent methyltransferase
MNAGSAPPQLRCPVCGASDSHRRFQAQNHHDGISGSWWTRECDACGSWFIEDVPTPDRLAGMYAEDYYSYRLGERPLLKRIALALIGYSVAPREPAFPQPGAVLDFGCGAGAALLDMKRRGWQCAGVEISPSARRVAAEHGLDVRDSTRGFADASFDYVRAHHSLEHVSDPGSVLAELSRVLRPGGKLFIGVPTTTSENARAFGPSWWFLTPPLHPFVPSTKGIIGLIERHGFRVVRVSTHSDYAGTAGSLQIRLNRGTTKRSTEGAVFALPPLLVLGHWLARLQDLRGVGDKLEIIAEKPR